MRAVVFSGTTEGRIFSRQLAQLGADVLVSVATPLGSEEQGSFAGITVHCGRLTPDEMAALVQRADLCVDATHPYAVDATRNIRTACRTAGVEYHRLLRAQSPLPAGSMVFQSAAHVADFLVQTQGNVLLATGAKELPAFAQLAPERLYPRVLPTLDGIAACEAAHIPHKNILALQGPFSYALNRALLEQFSIRFLVTKDGGAAGGFAEKAQAAADTGVQLIVIRRPAETGETADQILTRCREVLKDDHTHWYGLRHPRQPDRTGPCRPAGADRILGAKRLLATLPEGCTGNRQALYKPDEILACLAAHPDEEIALVYSGDTGFYSGASQLLPMLRAFGISCRVLPGLSSVQLLAAAVGAPGRTGLLFLPTAVPATRWPNA